MFRKRYRRKELNAAQKREILTRDKLSCVQCSAEIQLKDIKTASVSGAFHHIIPLVYGGENLPANACLLCRPCHNKVHSGSEDKEKYFAMFALFIRTGKLF